MGRVIKVIWGIVRIGSVVSVIKVILGRDLGLAGLLRFIWGKFGNKACLFRLFG
jgi:hypothetical protein